MDALSDSGSGTVTVTCQASLRELRAAAFWLYLHDRAAHITILLVIAGAIVIFGAFDRIVGHWNAFIVHPSWMAGRGIASAIWLLGFGAHRVWLLWTLPERAWQRMQREGSTTLTVSPAGLSWYNSVRRNQAGWDQYVGYALLPEVLILVSSQPYIVPRSTVSALDFERVLAIAKCHLQPVTRLDSQKPRA
jgi:hypothetical protein